MDFLLLWDHTFIFFGDNLEYFLCSMNNKLIVLDLQLNPPPRFLLNEKLSFCGFSVFRPSMVSRTSLGRLPGPKARQNVGSDMHSLLFWDHAFTFFGDTLENFLCSMSNN